MFSPSIHEDSVPELLQLTETMDTRERPPLSREASPVLQMSYKALQTSLLILRKNWSDFFLSLKIGLSPAETADSWCMACAGLRGPPLRRQGDQSCGYGGRLYNETWEKYVLLFWIILFWNFLKRLLTKYLYTGSSIYGLLSYGWPHRNFCTGPAHSIWCFCTGTRALS